ncbi:MAG: hypothetical protein P8P85_01500 [Acidimicrobiales bacterium]|nr:hypothetical protein [Acidimicrobiales bacterium]MDG2217483.1 hypothetical protein [Acidimicrobiales bacterium]
MAALFAAVAASPSIAASPEADERFHIYTFAARFKANPLKIVGHAFDTVPDFLDRGNYRPLGRIVEWSGQVFVGEISLLFNLPINVSLGVLRLISAALLAASIVWLVSAVLRRDDRQDSRATMLPAVSVLVGASFLVSQTGGPVNLFAWLYLGTSAIAVLAAKPLAAADLYGGQLSRRRGVAFVLIGIVLASTNEITAIAIPLGLVTIVARSVVLGLRPAPTLLRLPVVRAWLLQLLGFLAVFIPVRVAIASRCGGDVCYSGSDFALTSAYPESVVGRMATGFVPTQWAEGLSSGAVGDLGGGTVLVLILAFLAVATPAIALYIGGWGGLDAAAPDRDSLLALGILGGGLALATTSLISLSQVLQDPSLRVGLAWRDSALATPGVSLAGAAVLAGLAHHRWFRKSVTPRLSVFAGGLLAMLMSFITTWAVGFETGEDPERILNNRIALEAVVFESSPEANEYRCGLLDDWADSYRDTNWEFRPDQLRWALTDFVRYAHDAPYFCDEG